MAYDEHLAQRVRAALAQQPNLVEKKMFGGIGFLLNGNMACGVYQEALIVRVGATNYPKALARPHVSAFDITGRPMRGWVMVDGRGCSTSKTLQAWVEQGAAFALSLEPK